MVKRMKRPTNAKEVIGGIFIDLGKLMFASFILGGVLLGKVPQYIILLAGFTGTTMLISLGVLWTIREKQDEPDKEQICG